MRVDLFDFDLPEACIALRPASPRDAARMLVVRPDARPLFEDAAVRDLPRLLTPGDVLVINDTKVIPARLVGTRQRGGTAARIEVMLHKREGQARWRAFARPAKRVAIGERIVFGEPGATSACLLGALQAEVEAKGEGGEVLLRFDLAGPVLDDAIHSFGHVPLPPYIAARRPDDAADRTDYQTVYACQEGAVAAPTAGLHFTDASMNRLESAGIARVAVTLHVGAGTFLPVKAADTAGHRMHAEWGSIGAATADALNAARAAGRRIVAVGTTSLRLIETSLGPDGLFAPWSGETDIFITPGYRFRAADALMTNFHLPRSTLFMLVSAFCGRETMQAAYRHAIAAGYRFYSYGDAGLLFKACPGKAGPGGERNA